MKIPAASALLALLCFLIPAAAESDTNLRYQLEMQRAQTRDAQEQASRERGARMDLQRELTKARDSSASVGAALSKQAAGRTFPDYQRPATHSDLGISHRHPDSDRQRPEVLAQGKQDTRSCEKG